ncbi:MAG: glycoside hydrolase family 92 protein, partial [Salinivirgaceae bacterium]|nr:glycoside hydrolase family 92 protein [Salinivirgaceae bacterium]
KEPITNQKYVNNRRTWINYSNQPNSHAAFIFNHAGAPWLTQYWSRTVVDSVFSGLSPYYGYQGDEDQGLMGSLAVLMKMGFFQISGGCEDDPLYELGSPLFDRVTIHLQPEFYQSPSFIITCERNNSQAPYIQSATLNNKPLKTVWFKHSDINKGAKISLKMGSELNKKCFN